MYIYIYLAIYRYTNGFILQVTIVVVVVL